MALLVAMFPVGRILVRKMVTISVMDKTSMVAIFFSRLQQSGSREDAHDRGC